MDKKRITDFSEITEAEMQGSVYLAESGDGAGTRHIKFEKLAEAIGRLLKLGDVKDLGTEEKKSFVGALNEVNKKTGTVFTGTDGIKAGTAGIVPAPQPEDEGKVLGTKGWVDPASGGSSGSKGRLKTIEEIEANTEEGYDVDALPIKEISLKSGDVTWIFDNSGKITGYKTKAGADAVFPFKGGETKPISFQAQVDGSSGQTTAVAKLIIDVTDYNLLTVGSITRTNPSITLAGAGIRKDSSNTSTSIIKSFVLSDVPQTFDVSGYTGNLWLFLNASKGAGGWAVVMNNIVLS